MESLTETPCDVVLSGTGLPQSLLALALSRSGKKVVHVDKNDYYGGVEAALSLQEAEIWIESTKSEANLGPFHHASLEKLEQNPSVTKLGSPGSYSLSLAPQLIYTRSNLLPTLVSSKVYRQLEFLAVGRWYIYEDARRQDNEKGSARSQGDYEDGTLHKIPGGREDIFADKSIDLRSARSLMKFLKLAADVETHAEILSEWGSISFPDYLSSQFGIPTKLQSPLLALTLSTNSPRETTTGFALPSIYRHLTSIGMFGPGFGAVIPKWGGLGEVAQVACRAGAVGGGVYILEKGLKSIEKAQPSLTADVTTDEQLSSPTLEVELDGGERIRTQWVCGTSDNLPLKSNSSSTDNNLRAQRSISIVSSSLSELFPPPSEGFPPLDGAVVVFPSGTLEPQESQPPVYLLLHSSGTGECPSGQCIIYANTTTSASAAQSSTLLSLAVTKFLASIREVPKPEILWTMSYQQTIPSQTTSESMDEHIIQMPGVPPYLALEDDVLRNVRVAWERIVGDEVGRGFMNFEDRETEEGDEGDDL